MSERISSLRKSLGLTMKSFGKEISIGASAVNDIEKGRRNASTQTVALICARFNVNEDWLYSGDGDMFSSSQEPELQSEAAYGLGMFMKLKPEFQDYVLQQIDKLIELQDKT